MTERDPMEKVKTYHDKWANRYDADYSQRAGLYHAVTNARLIQHLKLPLEAAILDAGGGTGIWTEVLLGKGFKNITLLDISQRMLDIARQKLLANYPNESIKILQGDVTSLKMIPDQVFECILALGDVLSYCNFTELALLELSRVSKPGATIIASVESRLGRAEELLEIDDIEGARMALEDGEASIGNPSWSAPFRARLFEPDEINKLFVDTGFEVISLVGKAILRTSIQTKNIEKSYYKWLIDFELAHGDDPTLIRRARWIEIVAQKPFEGVQYRTKANDDSI